MRRILKYCRWLLALLMIVAVILSGSGYFYLRGSLPNTQGTIRVEGLWAAVTVERDTDGVPHIYAENKLDAIFGLGYVHAQDRLWEMEIWRRITQGRFAEIFGPLAVADDRYLRALGFHRAGQLAWEAMPPEDQDLINAYTDGVNAFISSHRGSQIPIEFTILGITPEPWTSLDSVAWAKIFSWTLSSNALSETLRADLIQLVGPERMQQLTPGYPEDGISTVSQSVAGHSYDQLIVQERKIESWLGVGGNSRGAKGSNAWVVDGTKTSTGKPMLANDPHLTLDIPGWYQAHISAGDFDVMGATIPGLPGVVIGRNRNIAWGFTGLNPDVQDFYRERLDSSGTMAEFQGRMEPMQIITETIKVKGAPDVLFPVRITRHGPLLSDAINANNANQPEELRPPKPLEPLSLRWTTLEAGDTTVSAFLAINAAENWEQVTQALSKIVAPGLNFVYADTAGNIGYYAAAGRVPIRAQGDGSLPLEGWTGANEWIDWVPFEELPHLYNPPEKMIVTANNRPIPENYPYFLGREWYPPYRAQRITDLLSAKQQFNLEDFAAIQNDTVSLQARELLPKLLALVTPQTPDEQQAIELLRDWDGDTRGDSAAAAIYEMWFLGLPRAIATDELQRKRTMMAYEANFTFTSHFLANVLSDRNNPWCDIVTTDDAEDCAVIAQETLRTALGQIRSTLGNDMQQWRWDKLHRTVFYHVPFQDVAFLRPFFSRSLQTGGDWSTVNIGAFESFRRLEEQRYENLFDFEQRFGASYRQIIDLSSPDGGRFIQTVGQSGHLLSPHYDDFMEDWGAGRYRMMRFDRSTIRRDQESVLRLEP